MDSGRKTILYLMEYPIDLPGGGQESTKTLCEGLAAGGKYEPVVACPDLLSTSVEDYKYRIITYPSDENRELSKLKRISNFLGRIGHFKRIIRQVHPDLIHVSMSESLISFGALRVLGFFSDIPFVYTDRGLRFGYRKHSLFCIKETMKRSACMLTTTRFNADLWKDLVTCPVKVIPNTISSAFSNYDENGRKRARQKYGIEDGEIVIGFAGRISEEKDWGKVPHVVEAISKLGIKYKVALVLSVYEERDSRIVSKLKEGITKVAGKDGLIYMQDLSQKEIAEYYYLVDFFIMTSNFESFGKAAVEAMSRKCVVLSTAVGGLPEVIGNPDDLYDMNDLGKLTARIKELTGDAAALLAEREMFYARYRQNYTIEGNIDRHTGVYDMILEAGQVLT